MTASVDRGVKLTKRAVEAETPKSDRYELWDNALPGFGIRIAPTGTKTFILRYRPKNAGRSAPKRFMTLGRFGPVTVDQARERARKTLGAVADGQDPARILANRRTEATVAEAAVEFMTEHVEAKRKPNTVASYRNVFDGHIVRKLGRRKLTEITRADIAKFHNSLRSTPHLANYAVAALGSLYTWAGRRGLVPEECNPARRVEKFPERPRERFLTSDELLRLGEALREAETTGIPWEIDRERLSAKHAPKPENRLTVVSPFAVAAIRLLLFTGCRRQEILNLQWNQVDFERGALFLPDSKTGRRTVILGAPAMKVLSELPHVGPFVISGADPEKARTALKRPWNAIRRRANLNGVRLHDLRHSFASVGAGAGLGLPIIGRLLGHTQPSTTARYAHLGDDPLRRASETISARISAAMGETAGENAEVVPLRRGAATDLV